MNHFPRTPLAFAGMLALSACTTVVPVKDVTSDPDAYTRKHFAASEVSPAIAAKLPKAGPARFGRLVLTQSVTLESNDGKKETNIAVTTVDDNGNGILSSRTELSGNGIPFGLLYETSYRGLLALRTQNMLLRAQSTSMIYEIKDITAINPIPTDIGATFTARFKTGTAIQITGFIDVERACTVERQFPAATLNAKLGGNAVEYRCEYRMNNTVVSRSKWVMLERYGYALQTEKTDSNSKTTYQITDVRA